MKKIYVIGLLLLILDGCKSLGIGTQCYICTTTASKAGTSSTSTKEICGVDDMKAYQKNSGTLINGVYTTINCVEK